MAHFIPRTDAELLRWLYNFKSKLTSYAPTFDMSAAELSALQSEIDTLTDDIHQVAAQKEELAKTVAQKEESRIRLMGRMRGNIARFKTHKNYSEATGQDLGIVGTADTLDERNYKPALRVEITGGVIRIHFRKLGVDGVNIYYRRKGEAAWKFLARDTRTPYDLIMKLDDPTKPEHLEFRAYGVVNDREIGQPSDVMEIVFGE